MYFNPFNSYFYNNNSFYVNQVYWVNYLFRLNYKLNILKLKYAPSTYTLCRFKI